MHFSPQPNSPSPAPPPSHVKSDASSIEANSSDLNTLDVPDMPAEFVSDPDLQPQGDTVPPADDAPAASTPKISPVLLCALILSAVAGIFLLHYFRHAKK